MTMVMLMSFLGMIVLSTVGASRPNTKAFQCLNNLRQVTRAWGAYAADNNEHVPNNFGVNDTLLAIQNGSFNNWANNIMTWSASGQTADISNTNTDWAVKTALGNYLRDAAKIYHCPADTYLSPTQRAAGFRNRIRSISMSSLFGHFSPGGDVTYRNPPLNWALSQYLQYVRASAVPKPAKTWLLIDEHPDSINDGYFLNAPTAVSWGDLPASFHDGGCGMSFADGHAEIRKWLSQTSQYGKVIYGYPSQKPFDSLGRLDFAWYLERSGYVDVATGKGQFGY